MNDAQVPEWLGRLADANKRIADLERIIGKQEEELHQRELDLADVLKKREQAEALAKQRLDVQHDINKQYLGEQIARQQAEAELAALKCCGNCGNIHAYNAGTDDEFRECPYLREDDAEHDYLSIGCHYNPSRWAARAEEGGGE